MVGSPDRLVGHFARGNAGSAVDNAILEGDCVLEVYNVVTPQNNPDYLHDFFTVETPTMPFVVRRIVLYSGTWRLYQSAQFTGSFIDVAVPTGGQPITITDITTYAPAVTAGMTAVNSIRLLYCPTHVVAQPNAPLILYSGGSGIPGGSWVLTSRNAVYNVNTKILTCECRKINLTWVNASIDLSDDWNGTLTNLDGVLVKDFGTNNGNTAAFKTTPAKPDPIYIYNDMPDLGQINYDNCTRSVDVREGKWRFYRKPNYVGEFFDLSVGQYNVAALMSTIWKDDFADTISSIKRIDNTQVVPPESQNAKGVEWHESTNFLTPTGYRNIKDLRAGDLLRCISPGLSLLGKFNYNEVFPQGSNNIRFIPGPQNIKPILGVVRVKSVGFIKTHPNAVEENGYYFFKVQNNPSGLDDITNEYTNITIPLVFRSTMPKKLYETDGKPETHLLMDEGNIFNQGYVLVSPGISMQNFQDNKWYKTQTQTVPAKYNPCKYSGANNFFLDVALMTYGNSALSAGDGYQLEIEAVDGNSSAIIIANGYYVTNLNFTYQDPIPLPTPAQPAPPNPGNPTTPINPGDPTPIANGCFTPDTLILLADGTQIPIEQIQVGAKLRSMRIPGLPVSDNFQSYKDWWTIQPSLQPFEATVSSVQVGQFSWHVELYFKDKFAENTLPPLRATPEHPLLVRRQNAWRFVEAINVRVGDYLFDYQRGPVLIENINRQPMPGLYYNLGVDGHNLYVAGGFIVHNTDIDTTQLSAYKQVLNTYDTFNGGGDVGDSTLQILSAQN